MLQKSHPPRFRPGIRIRLSPSATVLGASLCIGTQCCCAAGAQTALPVSGQQMPIPLGPPVTAPTHTQMRPISGQTSPVTPLGVSPGLTYIRSQFGSDHALTLPEAISVALSNNRTLAFAAEALYSADAKVAESDAAFLPTLNTGPADVFLHDQNRGSFVIQATLPVDVSGLLAAARDQAQFQDISSRLDYNRARNQVVFEVAQAFYDVLRAKALVTVAVENQQDSRERLRDAIIRYTGKQVAYLDVVRAQTDAANSEKVVIAAKNTLSVSVGLLNSKMGLDITIPTRIDEAHALEMPPGIIDAPDISAMDVVTGPLPDAPAPAPGVADIASAGAVQKRSAEAIALAMSEVDAPEFRGVLTEAIANRPEIMQAEAQISAAKKGIQIARRSTLPSLGVSVGYYSIRSSTGTPINEPEAIVGLNIPLYDAGVARDRVKQARAEVAASITSKRDVTDHIALEVQQAYLGLVQARDQVAVANQAVVQARTAFSIARVRYNAGVGSRAGLSPLLEFADAQAALILAETNRVNALYDYNAARVGLDRSTGRFAYLKSGPGFITPPSASVLRKGH